MAGGSADAAAVLVGLNELYGARLSMSELCALGVSIGADVPFALMGGTCRVQGLGDLIKALPPLPECWFTVVMPGYGISTPEAFAAYDKVGSSVHPDCAAQEAAIRAGDLDAVCAAAGNALEECSGAKDNEAIKAALRENGAVTALMTGSGAAVFGVFRTEAEAKAAADALRARWPQVYTAQPVEGRGSPLSHAEGVTSVPRGATTTTAASGGNRESLLGQRPARRKRSAADAGSRNPGAKHLWRVGQVSSE